MAAQANTDPDALINNKATVTFDFDFGPVGLVECGVCCDSAAPCLVVAIEESPVCFSCATQMFQDAIVEESRYPVKWGPLVLEIEDFDKIIPAETRDLFRAKEVEYNCPPSERLYCGSSTLVTNGFFIDRSPLCGTFLGRRQDDDEATLRCQKCGYLACARCGRVVGNGIDASRHTCQRAEQSQEDEAAFMELKRGTDYQICPSKRCGRKVQLIDGCNHVTCMCGQQLCFVCGDPVTMSSAHWTRTTPDDVKCPRYNQPSSGNARWDDMILANEEEAHVHFMAAEHQRIMHRRNAVAAATDRMAMHERPHDIDSDDDLFEPGNDRDEFGFTGLHEHPFAAAEWQHFQAFDNAFLPQDPLLVPVRRHAAPHGRHDGPQVEESARPESHIRDRPSMSARGRGAHGVGDRRHGRVFPPDPLRSHPVEQPAVNDDANRTRSLEIQGFERHITRQMESQRMRQRERTIPDAMLHERPFDRPAPSMRTRGRHESQAVPSPLRIQAGANRPSPLAGTNAMPAPPPRRRYLTGFDDRGTAGIPATEAALPTFVPATQADTFALMDTQPRRRHSRRAFPPPAMAPQNGGNRQPSQNEMSDVPNNVQRSQTNGRASAATAIETPFRLLRDHNMESPRVNYHPWRPAQSFRHRGPSAPNNARMLRMAEEPRPEASMRFRSYHVNPPNAHVPPPLRQRLTDVRNRAQTEQADLAMSDDE